MKKLFIVILLLFTKAAYAQHSINFSAICVDSVWYDAMPGFINVSVYNGDTIHINYPTVQIINPNGDTISNRMNILNFFAHPQNQYQTYTDSITVNGITDFSNYTFIFYDNLWDTVAVIDFCEVTSIKENNSESINIYPNPVDDVLYIEADRLQSLDIYNLIGENVKRIDIPAKQIDVSELKRGTYFIILNFEGKRVWRKLVKE